MSSGGIHMDKKAVGRLDSVDSVVFDCDGVLVDIRKSYDLTIKKTARYVLENAAAIPDPMPVTPEIIDGFKATGGFNDEVDLTYAAILSVVAARNTGSNPRDFVMRVIQNSDDTGIKSVEKYLDASDVSGIRAKLDYPGDGTGLLHATFNQIFYGPDMFYSIFKKKSAFAGPGLIENDMVILGWDLLARLRARFCGKTAIVSGRGAESIRRSLGAMLDEFDLASSFFLEDHPRSLAKPNPESLIRSVSAMRSGHCLYVGDSFEDLLMARRATDAGVKTTFCGITGTSADPQKKLALFEKHGVMAIDSIDLLPKVLNQ